MHIMLTISEFQSRQSEEGSLGVGGGQRSLTLMLVIAFIKTGGCHRGLSIFLNLCHPFTLKIINYSIRFN